MQTHEGVFLHVGEQDHQGDNPDRIAQCRENAVFVAVGLNEIAENDKVTSLEHVQWADWHADGRLLVATVDGKLQIRDYSGTVASVRSEIDLRPLTPNPLPPPDEAYRW